MLEFIFIFKAYNPQYCILYNFHTHFCFILYCPQICRIVLDLQPLIPAIAKTQVTSQKDDKSPWHLVAYTICTEDFILSVDQFLACFGVWKPQRFVRNYRLVPTSATGSAPIQVSLLLELSSFHIFDIQGPVLMGRNMGSPVLPTDTNLYIEEVKKSALLS